MNINNKYFISAEKFNCPICDSNSVLFNIHAVNSFNWSKDRLVYYYTIQCSHCSKKTFHFSNYRLETIKKERDNRTHFYFDGIFPDKEDILKIIENDGYDELFFFSAPRGNYELNDKVPKVIREIVFEAVDCARGGFNTGSSACIRKAIYELLVYEKIVKSEETWNYDERIDALKDKFKEIEPAYITILKTVQGITSVQLHESPWKKLKTSEIYMLLATLKEVLYEMYVIPEERKERLQAVQKMVSPDSK